MEINDVAELGLEGAGVLLICVIAFKIYRMKCNLDSKCFKNEGENGIEIHTQNSGVQNSV
tara:strand:- start:535 stop:714 length:180 start_codon:yes stop_codon:yes gene_type:complete